MFVWRSLAPERNLSGSERVVDLQILEFCVPSNFRWTPSQEINIVYR
jgi:hypothetical protein